jgi:3-phosphoshikimate 1-carboxyvinyltransferase
VTPEKRAGAGDPFHIKPRAAVVEVAPAVSVRGALAVPGDKSISHRALLLGAIADGESRIRGLGRSGDIDATMHVLGQLGVGIVEDGDEVLVQGSGLRALGEPSAPLDCANAGTLMRLVTGVLAGQRGRFELVGDESLSRRPMERVAEPLREMGARIETAGGHAPVVIEGGELHPIRYELPVASAQVKSAILLAGLFAADGPTWVLESVPTRDHTERLLQALGARVHVSPGHVRVWPAARLAPLDIDVPGDVSAAAPLLLAATLLPDSKLIIRGVGINPTRTGFLHVLDRMGARISLFNRRTVGREPVADLEVAHAELVATEVQASEVPTLVDELPLFALAAAMAHGESRVRGAQELHEKETDRIESVTNGLRGLGVHIRGTYDGFRVRGVPTRPRGGGMDSGGDHRIAILGAVAGLVSRDGVKLEGAEAAAVSFPGFFDLLNSLAQR